MVMGALKLIHMAPILATDINAYTMILAVFVDCTTLSENTLGKGSACNWLARNIRHSAPLRQICGKINHCHSQ